MAISNVRRLTPAQQQQEEDEDDSSKKGSSKKGASQECHPTTVFPISVWEAHSIDFSVAAILLPLQLREMYPPPSGAL